VAEPPDGAPPLADDAHLLATGELLAGSQAAQRSGETSSRARARAPAGDAVSSEATESAVGLVAALAEQALKLGVSGWEPGVLLGLLPPTA
jgi:hypothetical protein